MSKGPFEWTDALLTGDAIIDGHHKTFYVKALKVHVACKLGKGDQVIGEMLGFMRDYAVFHFEEEEIRMRVVRYPYLRSHLEAHRGFLGRLAELEREFEQAADKKDLAREIAEMSVGWFTQHICNVDRPLVEYLAAHSAGDTGDDARQDTEPSTDKAPGCGAVAPAE